ncbi:unnamed protein product [marine sediment metagenome]|uniref:Uncharacterized protein n=1 Tax=marine sediment metagenome TaxID=412755 RepID=X0YPS7_9ZZZZ
MDYATISLIIGGLLALSEMLSLIPAVKANGIFQTLWNILKIVAGKPEDK